MTTQQQTIGPWGIIPMIIGIGLIIWMYMKVAKYGNQHIKEFIRRREKELGVKLVYKPSPHTNESMIVIKGPASKRDKNYFLFQIFLKYLVIYFGPITLIVIAIILLVPKDLMNMRFS